MRFVSWWADKFRRRGQLSSVSWLTAPGDDTPPTTYPEIRLSPGVHVAESADPAAWLTPRLLPWGLGKGTPVGAIVPTGYGAYARVFHPARGAIEGEADVRWSEVAAWAGRVAHSEMQWEAISLPAHPVGGPPPWREEPEVGRCPMELRRSLVEAIRAHTATPERCWVCVWEGWGDAQEVLADAPQVRLSGRGHALLHAPLHVIAEGVLIGPWPSYHEPAPSLWWPEDRAWCVATEIDFRWTYVAGSRACIDDILRDPRIEALPSRPDDRGDYLSDEVNGPVAPE